MNTVNRQLVTIIAESVIEQKLIDDVKGCGVKQGKHATGSA